MNRNWFFGNDGRTDYLIDTTGSADRNADRNATHATRVRTIHGISSAIHQESRTLSSDVIDKALQAITSYDFLTEIENNPILGELTKKYNHNWQKILSNKTRIDAMLAHIHNSLISDREYRKGFDPGYVKILLFIQDKYRIYQENIPR